MVKVGTLSAQQEDYLEVIFDLVREFGVARISEVARRKSVRKASATQAIAKLAKAGLVIHVPYSDITLTTVGAKLARQLDKRHAVLKRFLEEIVGVKPDIADKDACIIEHHVHPETVDGLVRFFARNGKPRKSK